ncbi:MAG: hypothetical protein U0231_15155 [Nitrospiraceae bacterium]
MQTLLDMKAMGRDVVDGHYLYEEESGRLSIDHLKPNIFDGFRRRMLSMVFKRCVDVFVAAVGLLMLIPLFMVLAVVIKVDSAGPVVCTDK